MLDSTEPIDIYRETFDALTTELRNQGTRQHAYAFAFAYVSGAIEPGGITYTLPQLDAMRRGLQDAIDHHDTAERLARVSGAAATSTEGDPR